MYLSRHLGHSGVGSEDRRDEDLQSMLAQACLHRISHIARQLPNIGRTLPGPCNGEKNVVRSPPGSDILVLKNQDPRSFTGVEALVPRYVRYADAMK